MASKHILIVDDEPRVASFLGEILELTNHKYHITTAKSGEEALQILRQEPADLLVTDLRMPGLSGLDLIHWARSANPHTRVILITAYSDAEAEHEAHHMNVRHYITKPFEMDDFTQVVETVLAEMTIAPPGFVILTDEALAQIAEELEKLQYNTGAMCILMADMQGRKIVEAGNTEGLDVTTLLALLGGGFVTNTELAHQFGEGESANLNFHQGTRYEIYAATVGDNLFIALVYDRQTQPSRIGVVWLYTRRAIDTLIAIVEHDITGAGESPKANDGAPPPEQRLGIDQDPLRDMAFPPPRDAEIPPIPRRRSRWDAQELPDISAQQEPDAKSAAPLLNLEQAMREGLVNPELRRLLDVDET